MPSFITAGNATNGLQVSSDNTGTLELRTGTGSGTTAMTVNASQVTSFSGNVGIGTSSPAARLGVSDGTVQIVTSPFAAGATGYFGTSTNHSLAFLTNNLERARIDASGNLLVGTTTQPAGTPARIGVVYDSTTTWGASYRFSNFTSGVAIAFLNSSGALVGNIAVTGSATSYVTSSDYRLKENIQPMTGALAKVAALKPCTYTWKADGSAGEGFIAHELAEIVPDAVTGEKDAVNEDGSIKPQGIDTSFLVATLTAAIQEQQAMIEELKAKVAALEGA